eukprot:1139810-Pelagomonas_calceolata.AAC.5
MTSQVRFQHSSHAASLHRMKVPCGASMPARPLAWFQRSSSGRSCAFQESHEGVSGQFLAPHASWSQGSSLLALHHAQAHEVVQKQRMVCPFSVKARPVAWTEVAPPPISQRFGLQLKPVCCHSSALRRSAHTLVKRCIQLASLLTLVQGIGEEVSQHVGGHHVGDDVGVSWGMGSCRSASQASLHRGVMVAGTAPVWKCAGQSMLTQHHLRRRLLVAMAQATFAQRRQPCTAAAHGQDNFTDTTPLKGDPGMRCNPEGGGSGIGKLLRGTSHAPLLTAWQF